MKTILNLICGSLIIAGSFAHADCFSNSGYQNFCAGSDQDVCNIYSGDPQDCQWADNGPPSGSGGGGYCTSNSGYQDFCANADQNVCGIYSGDPQDCFWVGGN